jgi:hypothetical protein
MRRLHQRVWEILLRKDFGYQQPNIPAIAANPNPQSWYSRCAGWEDQYHVKLRIEKTGWRCRYCGQLLNPPDP